MVVVLEGLVRKVLVLMEATVDLARLFQPAAVAAVVAVHQHPKPPDQVDQVVVVTNDLVQVVSLDKVMLVVVITTTQLLVVAVVVEVMQVLLLQAALMVVKVAAVRKFPGFLVLMVHHRMLVGGPLDMVTHLAAAILLVVAAVVVEPLDRKSTMVASVEAVMVVSVTQLHKVFCNLVTQILAAAQAVKVRHQLERMAVLESL